MDPSPGQRWPARLRPLLPHGGRLPAEVRARRHRGVLALLWLHVPGLFLFALAVGETVAHAAFEAGVVAAIAILAGAARWHPTTSITLASVGLLTCSAELVHLTDGLIEMHFHFFVMIGVVTLYQEWAPYLVSMAFVVAHHGVMGVIDPESVYNHPTTAASPWQWLALHAGFIFAMSIVGIVSWKLNELLLADVTRRQRALQEAQAVARLGSWEHRTDTGRSLWSRQLYRLIGVEPFSVPATIDTVRALVHPDDREGWDRTMAGAAEAGTTHDLDFRIVRPDGEVRWLHGRGQARPTGRSSAVVVTGTIQDITDRKLAEQALHESSAATREALSLLHATLDSTADAILVVDRDGRISSYNGRFAAMWGLPEDGLAVGGRADQLARVAEQVHDPESYLQGAAALTADEEAESLDVVRFRDGRVFERFSMPQRVDGEIVGRVWSFRDVTDRTRLEAELVHEAFHDSLTGLPNKALFQDRLDHALARQTRSGTPAAVLFIDLDNFKNVNDSLGHAAGDELIVQVTDRLQAQLRAADTVARLGGDEFAVLLEDLPAIEEADAVAATLLQALEQPFHVAGTELFTSASIGIAAAGQSATGEQVLRDADLAMYTAKRLGKDRAERFETHMHATAMERLELGADLRRAIERDELRLQYQPIVSLTTGELVSVEALVRWQHPRRGLLGPGAFIPYAEESGTIDQIGLWVLEQACAQTREWQRLHDGGPVGVSVNLAPRQLRDQSLVPTVARLLTATGLDPAQLTLEITETAMMVDADLALLRLQQLKALGVRLAIDDFGTGYSSLSHLRQFPIDIIKIDRSFVDRVEHGPEESALTRAIVRLAQTLDLVAVAEGVETARQAELLREMGCQLAQGYHLSRPVDADVITARLAPERAGVERLTGV